MAKNNGNLCRRLRSCRPVTGGPDRLTKKMRRSGTQVRTYRVFLPGLCKTVRNSFGIAFGSAERRSFRDLTEVMQRKLKG
jgi:hypothetical protein